MQNRIAFIHYGSFSHANQSLLEAFRRHFAEYEIDVIDVLALIKQRKDLMLINLFHLCKEHGIDLLLRRRSVRRSFFRTTYMFEQCSRLASRHISPAKHAFSIQTQSLFDASTQAVPHFVYTDHTALANLQYADVRKRKALHVSAQWLARERRIYQNATVNFTLSNHVTRSLVQEYGCSPGNVVRAFAGSNVAVGAHAADKRYDQKNILFVGVDWERKGGPHLVAAFQQILQKHPDAQLTIVGCVPDVDVPNVRVIGRVPNAEMGRYYAAASVFCLPTRREPFGFVFIEAMAHKLPIVATNIAAIPDFVSHGQSGYMVAPDDIDGLAQALIDLLENPERCRAFGERGYRTCTEHYSWDNVARIMKNTITAAIAAPEVNSPTPLDDALQPASEPPWGTARWQTVS